MCGGTRGTGRTLPAVLDSSLVPARVMEAEDLMTLGTGRGTPGSDAACTLALCSSRRLDTALAPISTPPATCAQELSEGVKSGRSP